MKKKIVKNKVGRPEGSVKDGSQTHKFTIRHLVEEKAQWKQAANIKETTLSSWMRTTLNTAAKRINK